MQLIQQTRECKLCKETKSLDQFYTQNKYSKTRGEWVYYNPECKECTKERSTKRQKEHRKDITEKQREYFKVYFSVPENKNKHRAIIRRRTKEGKNKQWYYENPGRFKTYTSNHRKHDINKKEWVSCKEYFNNECAYCGLHEDDHFTVYDGKLRKSDLHKEHVDHNGANDISNCIPACRICNSSKWQYKLEDWYNDCNDNYTNKRIEKIYKWINEDYKNCTIK